MVAPELAHFPHAAVTASAVEQQAEIEPVMLLADQTE